MSKTKRKEKPSKPRGEYRARWDIPHSNVTDYNRKRDKSIPEDELEEIDKDLDWFFDTSVEDIGDDNE